MKKITITLAIIILVSCFISRNNQELPKDSIRFRIVAQNNDQESQKLKKEIVLNLKEEIDKIERSSKNISDSRKNIKKELPTINKIIKDTIIESGTNKNYTIKYGLNYFPQKEYQGIIYEEGQYESLVITIEEGKGDNFWCVLFPPLCLIDPTQNTDEIEYTSWFKELINKYF